MANIQAIDVKFSQDLTHRKSLNRLIFDRVIGKIKSGRFWDTVYIPVFPIIQITLSSTGMTEGKVG